MDNFKVIGGRLSNWGRWGAEDQRGTLNLITPERIVDATHCVRTGKVFELSIPIGADGPQTGRGGRINPLHFMTVMPTDDLHLSGGINISDDFISMPLQGATQWDSLAHVGYDDVFYNNVSVHSVMALGGATAQRDRQRSAGHRRSWGPGRRRTGPGRRMAAGRGGYRARRIGRSSGGARCRGHVG